MLCRVSGGEFSPKISCYRSALAESSPLLVPHHARHQAHSPSSASPCPHLPTSSGFQAPHLFSHGVLTGAPAWVLMTSPALPTPPPCGHVHPSKPPSLLLLKEPHV